MRRLVTVTTIAGIPISLHWSLVGGMTILFGVAVRDLAVLAAAGIGLAAYFGTMLLHEGGHAVLARRRGVGVHGIDLYPFLGQTRIDQPRSRLDGCVIAWGGVLFQSVVGIPMLVWILRVGYTPIESVNAFMAVFSYLTVVMVPLNLIPVRPLDGAAAWGIVPLMWSRLRQLSWRAPRPKGRKGIRLIH